MSIILDYEKLSICDKKLIKYWGGIKIQDFFCFLRKVSILRQSMVMELFIFRAQNHNIIMSILKTALLNGLSSFTQ